MKCQNDIIYVYKISKLLNSTFPPVLANVAISGPESKTVVVKEDGEVNIECTAPADVNVEWLHNGMTINITEQADKYRLRSETEGRNREHTLTIRNANQGDKGTYRCRNVDDILFDTDDATVTVTTDTGIDVFTSSYRTISTRYVI